jgi:uncharacterized membrane protein YciS (DUF1049 family)
LENTPHPPGEGISANVIWGKKYVKSKTKCKKKERKGKEKRKKEKEKEKTRSKRVK